MYKILKNKTKIYSFLNKLEELLMLFLKYILIVYMLFSFMGLMVLSELDVVILQEINLKSSYNLFLMPFRIILTLISISLITSILKLIIALKMKNEEKEEVGIYYFLGINIGKLASFKKIEEKGVKCDENINN